MFCGTILAISSGMDSGSILRTLLSARVVILASCMAMTLMSGRAWASPLCARAAANPEIFEVAEFVELLAPRLGRTLARWRKDRLGSRSRAVIHEDPGACRFCNGAQMWLMRYLKLRFPHHDFRGLRSRTPVEHGYFHDYVYSPKLDLMIDATYRQFLTSLPPEDFAKLPRIFVGRPDEFRQLLAPHASKALIERILLTFWFSL